jgi:hypothetical protein
MQVIGLELEAQCGFMPGKTRSTVDAIFAMRVSLQKHFRFQKDRDWWVLFVDFVRAFDTVPSGDALQGLARLGSPPPKIISLVHAGPGPRVFHENVTLEVVCTVDLDHAVTMAIALA